MPSLRAQFVIREDLRLYALIERYPWILNTPPVPPGGPVPPEPPLSRLGLLP
jgi:hypothetical protein